MYKRIVVELSEQSINNAIAEIEKYKERVIRRTKLLAKRLAEYGHDVSQFYIAQLDAIDTYELYNSIKHRQAHVFTNGAVYRVYTNCEYAPFVEFGTGIVGAQHPHPNPQAVGQYNAYDSQGHGNKGWYYMGRDGQIHHTLGMPARPFLHDTAITLLQECEIIAQEIFRYG